MEENNFNPIGNYNCRKNSDKKTIPFCVQLLLETMIDDLFSIIDIFLERGFRIDTWVKLIGIVAYSEKERKHMLH